MTIKNWILCGAAVGVLASASAQAETADERSTQQAIQEESSGGIETVVVTARKRSESIQSVPVAVTALDADLIEKRFVHDLTDLNHEAPNMQIEGVGAIHRNAALIYSRGIGYVNVDQGQDPAVGISVDGVFFTRNIGSLQNMLDIDQVEILRGPQGTLFGKNTVGGVINVTTKKASTEDHDLELFARLGNLGRWDYSAVFNLPIDDTLAVRFAYQSQFQDGPFRNVSTVSTPFDGPKPRGDRYGGFDVKTFRTAVHWEPVSNLTFDLTGTYIKDRSPSVGGQNGSFGGVPGKLPPDLLWLLGIPGYRTFGGPSDPYIISRDVGNGDFQDSKILTLNGRYHADWFDIVSVTGYMHDSNLSYNDYDNTPLAVIESTYGLHHQQFTQEFRLESNDDDSPLKWVTGLYYLNNQWDAEQHLDIGFLAPAPFDRQEDYAHQNAWSIAPFVQADYKITDALEVSAGVRYTHEDKNIFRLVQYAAVLGPSGSIADDHDWSDFTYHAGINYRISPDMMTYFKFDTGFVGGGWNSRANDPESLGPFAPEKAHSYEIGLKSDWLDHRLRVNAAAFWANYANLQVGVFHSLPGHDQEEQVVANDAFERARGVELEVTAVPIDRLTLSASIGYLDAIYTSFNSDLLGILPDSPFYGLMACNGSDKPGKTVQYADHNSGCYVRPAYTPNWTMRYEASYAFELNGHGVLTPDVYVTYESSHFTDLLNEPVGYQPGYALLNGSLNYDDPDGRFRISLWAKNITDTRYIVSDVPTAGLFTQLYFADPRTFGVDLRIKTDWSNWSLR
jgi:iron complex outermembrane receptor protein